MNHSISHATAGCSLLLGCLLGCSSSQRTAPSSPISPTPQDTSLAAPPARNQPASGPPSAPRRARIAYTREHTLCIRSADSKSLGPATCHDLPSAVSQLAWLDDGRVVTLLDSERLFTLEGSLLRELAMPPDSSFATAPPTDASGSQPADASSGGPPSHLYIKGDEVWLARCAWWVKSCSGGCVDWVSVRVEPSPTVDSASGEPPGYYGEPLRLFADSLAPRDVSLRLSQPQGDVARLTCEVGNERGTFQAAEFPGSNVSLQWSWVPGSSSLYVLAATYDHLEAETDQLFLLRACDPQPVARIEKLAIGPGHFWAHGAEDTWQVRFEERVLGELSARHFAFAGPN